ncbi:phage tail protein [Niallia sp. 03190]|uniref:phage tail protein n=1 Tax=Niallia sp. 03190 TaxID=3458061 RepID=UPI004044F45D
MVTYTTVSGDTFDKIALDQLGSEYLFPLLLEANPQYRYVLIFSSGVVLNIPEYDIEDDLEEIPEWLEVDMDETTTDEEETVLIASEEDS